MQRVIGIYILFFLFVLMVQSCTEEPPPEPCEDPNVTDSLCLDYTATPMELEVPYPNKLPVPNIPASNPLTVEGVQLGRMLFYDPILSGDNTMACATCHKQENAFAVNTAVSVGIDGIAGTRNSMPLFNLAYGPNSGFTWDGRATSLEAQCIEPIENPIEMHQNLEDAIDKLEAHADYPLLFKKAFNTDIDADKISKAISQFLRTIVSNSSRFDLGTTQGSGLFLSPAELRGKDLYELETFTLGEMECIHCHGGILFTAYDFFNNGLDPANSIEDFPDPGVGGVTGQASDYGLFKVPTLRNLLYTAPYMHDGRFQTLEEVIDHYSEGTRNSPTISVDLASPHTNGVTLNLTEQQKADLVIFLKSLSDPDLLTNPAYSNPFE